MFLRAGYAVLLSTVFLACSNSGKNAGDAHFNKGEYAEAVDVYSQNLKFKPNDVTMLYNRGRAHEEQGSFDSAKVDFEKALELEPTNFQVLLSLSNLHYSQKNYAKALLYANRAEEIPGAPALASFLKARALQQLGNPEDALKAYENAIKLDKEFGQAYFNRGLLKIALKRTRSACEDFQLASSLEYPGASDALKKYCK